VISLANLELCFISGQADPRPSRALRRDQKKKKKKRRLVQSGENTLHRSGRLVFYGHGSRRASA
jgi:hypothetical protein